MTVSITICLWSEAIEPLRWGALPVWMEGNVFLKGAKPSKHEKDPLVKADFDPDLNWSRRRTVVLEVHFDKRGVGTNSQTGDHRVAR